MDKKRIVIIVVVLAVVGGGGYYLWSSPETRDKIAKGAQDLGSKAQEFAKSATETASQAAKSASQNVQNTIKDAGEAASEQVGQIVASGSMQLQLDGQPQSIGGCHVVFSPPGENRPGVVQFRSHAEMGDQSPPAALVWASVQAKTPAELVGQKLQALVFVQPDSSGAVWHTAGATTLELTISQVDGDSVTASLAAGTLTDAASGKTGNCSATLDGVLR